MSDKQVSKNDMSYLKDLAKRDNDANLTVERLPVLKINYNNKSKVAKLGEWVLGQKSEIKDKVTKIIEEGIKIDKIVILRIRNQYTYFDEKEKKNNCFSPIHKDFEKVEGSNYHNICGAGCPYRNLKDRKCNANKVVYVCSLTSDKQIINSVIYLKGSSFMTIGDYLKEAAFAEIDDERIPIPYYSFTTTLETKTGQNKAAEYYVAVFKKGNMLKKENVDTFAEKIADVDKFIDFSNSTRTDIAEHTVNDVTPTNMESTTGVTEQVESKSEPIVISDADELFS